MIAIKQLGDIEFESIHKAFLNAFSDYVEPFDLTCDQLKYMIERRGCDLNLSFGAFEDNDLVGFTLNGIGEWNGELTAYDTGTGVVKEFRKQGIASRIFEASLPVLKENNIYQYLLEVIKSNKPAYDLYKKAGFETTREFDYFKSDLNDIKIKKEKIRYDLRLEEIIDPDWSLLKSFWDFKPSWQNSIDSIERKREYFNIMAIYAENQLAGYGIIEEHTGDIPQFAIDRKFRRKGLAATLFNNLMRKNRMNSVKIINTTAGYGPFLKFAESINLMPGIGQYEMILKL